MSVQEKKKLTNKFTYIFGVSGIAGVMLFNGLRRRFLWQGIYVHATTALVGGYLGTKYGEWGDREGARRDYIINEYISRHPEDFQKPPDKTVGEWVTKWRPIR